MSLHARGLNIGWSRGKRSQSIAAVAGVLAVGCMCLGVANHRSAEPQLTPVVAPVDRIYAAGRIEGQTPEVELHATLTERVLQVQVQEGDVVQPGQVLIYLDDQRYRAEEQLAEAGLRLAQTRLERLLNGARESEIEAARSVHQARAVEHDGAARTMDRMNRLRLAGAASGQSIEDAEVQARVSLALMQAAEARLQTLTSPPRADEVASLKAEVAAAEAQLQLAQAMRAKTVIVAPTAGEILEIRVEPGELAAPGTPLVVMCDTRRLRVRADVEELDALHVAVGQTATITADGLSDSVLHGRVTHLRPRLNDKRLTSGRPGERLDSRTREIWIDLISPPPLVIGLPVDVWIQSSETATEPRQAALKTARRQ